MGLSGEELLRGARSRYGRVAYSDITDGTRWTFQPKMYSSAEAAVRETAQLYRRNLWADQDDEIMILSEKDAITGVVQPVTDEWGVSLGIVRGYSSTTFTWSVAQAISYSSKPVTVYQLGDHDPSGLNAWQSFQLRVQQFLVEELGGQIGPFIAANYWPTFKRLAVRPEQIAAMNLPTRPTKASDPRAANFDGESVEVDAIPAAVLRQIVREAIESHIDPVQLENTQTVEAAERDWLDGLAAAG